MNICDRNRHTITLDTLALGQVVEPGAELVLRNGTGRQVRLRVTVDHLDKAPRPRPAQYAIWSPQGNHYLRSVPFYRKVQGVLDHIDATGSIDEARKFATVADAVQHAEALLVVARRQDPLLAQTLPLKLHVVQIDSSKIVEDLGSLAELSS